jgi:Rieske 2Fe-2S family protein
MTSKGDIDALIEGARDSNPRTQPFYCDEEIFARDMQQVVSHKWLLVDHVSRIPEAGQYFLYEIGQESIIVIRDQDMTINALFNVCRHRGSLICLEPEGKRHRLTCPYHSWTYRLDGTLQAAPLMPEDFNPLDHGLRQCHVRVHHGFIFLNLSNGDAPEFDEEFAVFEPILDFHGFADAKIAHRESYPTIANWKLVVENFLECYHCVTAHKEFCSRHLRDALVAIGAGPNSGPQDAIERFAPVLQEWEEKAARLGRPLGTVDDDESSLHMKFCQQRPHRSDIESESEDGQPVARLMGKRTECDYGRMHLSFSPFNHIIACNDFAALITLTPRGVMGTDVEIIWLVDGRADTVDVDRMIWMWDVTTRQDKEITENNQRGILSSRYEPGSLSEQERRVNTFNKWYLNQLTN